MKTLAPVLPIIRSHHERWDGSGYPDGLAGEDIPWLARILQVSDIYDALTSERPYKSALSPAEAFAVMEEEVRRGWRDPELVPLFASTIQTNPSADLTSLEASLANMRTAVSRCRRSSYCRVWMNSAKPLPHGHGSLSPLSRIRAYEP